MRAPRVVVACGALESPALLLRSGIGGPAAGHNLRLHPCTAVMGQYEDDTRAWWGAPHAGLVDEFAGLEDGYGFLIESDPVRDRHRRARPPRSRPGPSTSRA